MNIMTNTTYIMILTPGWLLARHAECDVEVVIAGMDDRVTSFGGPTGK
jgi:hypothetical protein